MKGSFKAAMVGVALASHIANVYIVGAARDAWLCGYTANLGSILFTLSVALLVVEQNLLPKTMCPLPCFFIQAYNVSAYLVCRFPVRGNEGKERKECQGTSQGIPRLAFPMLNFQLKSSVFWSVHHKSMHYVQKIFLGVQYIETHTNCHAHGFLNLNLYVSSVMTGLFQSKNHRVLIDITNLKNAWKLCATIIEPFKTAKAAAQK